ncbi:ATP-binding protein [Elusimicrobiota bacterium]
MGGQKIDSSWKLMTPRNPSRQLTRYLADHIDADLTEKMVFLGGPRQVGKTTLSLGLLRPKGADESHAGYLNWDDIQARGPLLRGNLPPAQQRIILDEIHKFKGWRNLVKGFYDKNKSKMSFLVTGSARLDYYRKGGDSLQGRYHYYRLHPLSVNELGRRTASSDLEQLLRFGGFPEPFLAADEKSWRRWHRTRIERVVYQDLRDLENVKEISLIELLVEHLPACVGSPLSIKSLSDLLQVSHASVDRWIRMLERLYVCFRIPPFGSPKIRAVRKEKKLYFWDWSQVETPGARFENMVASQLLKYCHLLEDTEGYRMELRFIRDTDKREIDFVVLQEKKPLFAVEVKTGERRPSPATAYFRERTSIRRFYQVHLGEKDYGDAQRGVRVLPFARFCKELRLP